MNSLNTDTAAREQETMMQRGFGMLSGKFSVLNRLAVVVVMAMVMLTGLVVVNQAHAAYDDPVFINAYPTNAGGTKITSYTVDTPFYIEVVLTDFYGNAITGASPSINKADAEGGGWDYTADGGANWGSWTESPAGTYRISVEITGGDQGFIFFAIREQSLADRLEATTVVDQNGSTTGYASQFDAAPSATCYTNATPTISWQLSAKDAAGNPVTSGTYNPGLGAIDDFEIKEFQLLSDRGVKPGFTNDSCSHVGSGVYDCSADMTGTLTSGEIYAAIMEWEVDSDGNASVATVLFNVNSNCAGTSPPPVPVNPNAPELSPVACNEAAPTVTFSTANQTITSDGGNAVYNYTVTNNDSGGSCGDTTFALGVSDDSALFATTRTPTSVTLAEGATSGTLTITVTANPGEDLVSTISTLTASEGTHANGVGTRTTDILIPCTPTGTILWDGAVSTANGDFAGASMVSSTSNVGTVQYQVTGGGNWGSCRTESSRATFAAGTTGGTVTLGTSISDLSQAFVLVDSTHADSPGNTFESDFAATGEITDVNTLTFTREGTVSDLEVSYQLVECFNNEFNVQRGDITLTGAVTTNTGSVAAVDTSKSMVIVNTRSSNATNVTTEHLITGEMSNATTVTVTRDDSGSNAVAHYQVVEFNPAAIVSLQTGESTVTGTSAAKTTVNLPSAVNDGTSWLYFTRANATSNMDDVAIAGNISNAGADLSFYHQDATSAARVRWYVVEFPNDGTVSVQRGVSTYNADVDPATFNITVPTAVNSVTKAFPYTTNNTLGNGSAFPRHRWVERLSTISNIELQGWNTETANADADMEWQVVEFIDGSSTLIPWSADPFTTPNLPSEVLSNGDYNIYARALDATCTSSYVYGDPSATNTTADGTAKSFTWSSCAEANTVNAPTFSPSTTPIVGAVTVNATGIGSTGTIEVSWSEDGGGSWSAWAPTGSTYTPSTCTSANVIFRSQGNASCGGKLITQGASVAFDTTETATVNVTDPGAMSGATTINVTLGGSGGDTPEWSPDGGSNWYASGTQYTPPSCAAAAVTFTARANGTCGVITDATPVNQNYDTNVTGSITVSAAQSLAGSPIDLTSIALLTDMNTATLTYTVGGFPGGPPDIVAAGTYIEAENFNQQVQDGGTNYQFTNGTDATANNNTYIENTSGSTAAFSNDRYRVDYDVNFVTVNGTTYYFWPRLRSIGSGNSVWWGIDGVPVGAITQTASTTEWRWSNAVQGGTGANNTTIDNGLHTINLWGRETVQVDGFYITTSNATPPGLGGVADAYTGATPTGATTIDPTATGGGSQSYTYAQAQSVDTSAWTAGTFDLTVDGNDTCGTARADGPTSFNWLDCTETSTLTLNPIADPITGNVSVTATGTATGIQVGTSPSPANASGWTYTPAQDDNTTTVSFYATGTGVCGTITRSQLNVATDTMAAPTVVNFTTPATVVDVAAPYDIPVTTFTGLDNLAVTGYMITESAVAPTAGAAGWSGTAPTSYNVPGYATYTLYAWVKDAAGNVSASSSDVADVIDCTPGATITITNPGAMTGSTPINISVSGSITGQAQWSANGGGSWNNSGTSYTPPAQSNGSVNFTAQATDATCSVTINATNDPLNVNYDTRTQGTEAGNATAIQTAIDTISVTMPYAGDVNGDATFQVDYKLASSGSWTNGTPTTDAGGSPYTQNISGLVSTEIYDVRVTYADADTVISGTATQTFVVVMVPWADSNMLHNSNRFSGTTTQGGNWGKPGGYAGGIVCSTCHGKETGNVKRINATISFPDGSTMPDGGNSAAVSLLTVEDGTSDFGDDSAAPRSSSSKVCEVCHTYDAAATNANGVAQHAADQSTAVGHYDNSDCIKCHLHNVGFQATCDSCHASPPIDNAGLDTTSNSGTGTGSSNWGAHNTHVNTLSFTDCNTCHNGWETNGEMPKADDSGDINVGFNAFGSTVGAYDGRTGAAYTASAGTTVTTGNGLDCTVYCHGSTIGGTANSALWTNADTISCGDCHANPYLGGNHTRHSGSSAGELGLNCNQCHGTTPSGGGDGHVDGQVSWNVSALTGNSPTYNGAASGAGGLAPTAYETCSNVYCHSDVQNATGSAGATAYSSPNWGGAAVCGSCHGDGVGRPTTGSHAVHTQACSTCHTGAGDETALHADGEIDVDIDNTYGASATYSQVGSNVPGNGFGNCSNVSCHGAGTPTWGSGSLSCDSCHGGEAADTTPIATNVHSKHILTSAGNYSLSCNTCHPVDHNGSVDVAFTGIGAGGTYTSATKTCSTLYCHGPSNTPDWDAGTGGNCGDCHGAVGTGRPDGVNEPSGANHLTGSHAAAPCTACHTHDGTDTTEHVNGPANANGDALVSTGGANITAFSYGTELGTSPDADGFKYSQANCTVTCHSSATWGGSGGCNFCHGYPPDGTGSSTDHFTRTGFGSTNANFYSAHGDCSTCHGVSGNATPPAAATARTGYIDLIGAGGNAYIDSMHNDGSVQMNGYDATFANGVDDKNAGYDGAGGCTKACHAQTVKLSGTIQTNTVELREFGAGDCNGCHDAGIGGAPVVTAASSHVDADGAGATYTAGTCTDCHPGGTKGSMHAKNGDANVAAIANNTTVGISYGHTVDTGVNGFVLGGDATTGTSEAEICWDCHDTNGISEWGADTGANNFTDPGNDYNYGTFTAGSNWIGAEWNSGTAKFAYKKGNILSTHTANSVDAGAPTTTADHGQANPDTVDQIRCSYCHDVHNLNAQTNDTSSGQPYLRGTWLGNPFPEDGAPQAGDSWTTDRFGAVPRGTILSNELGGYQINQNNTAAMTGFTVANSSGLCELCHGDGNGTFTAGEIDALNQFGTDSADWVGTNGHSATALGGGDSVAQNIFTVGDRNTTAPSFANGNGNGVGAGNPAMANTQQLASDSEVYSFRDLEGDGFTLSPQVIDNRQNIVQTYSWGADTDSALDANYHNFSCSKCHNPHASRLPRLMITNCLDTNHNDWDDDTANVDPIPGTTTENSDRSSFVSADNANVTFSNATSAQNCHRVKDPAFTNSKGTGWNYVTPW